jgi:hypothetical protein
MSISVKQVSGRAGIREFIDFQFTLYRESKVWVPPMIASEMKTLDPAFNPSHAMAESVLFLAFRKGQIVGRIAAIAAKDRSGIEGRFGWYDVIDDLEVSKALIAQAGIWLRAKGASQIKGPMGFTNLDKAGLVIMGFDELPTIATIYNYPYYNDHLNALGFVKSADYIEYEFVVPPAIPEKITAFAGMIAQRYGLSVVDCKQIKDIMKYGSQLFELINETHRHLYGFKLLSEEMKQYYTKKYLSFIQRDFIALVVNAENQLVAYALTMPSLSRAFQKARGLRFPFGFWHIRRAVRHIDRVDLMLIGVTDHLRNKGVTALVFQKLLTTFIRYGVKRVESNPELENNPQVHALWHAYESRQHKRRRVYQRDL